MLKIFITIFIFNSYLLSNAISCIGDIQNPNYAYNHLIEGAYPDTPRYFYDNSSVACGGDELTLNLYVSPFDNGYEASDGGIVDSSDSDLIVIIKDGKYINNKIFINNIPCLPVGTVSFKSYVDSDGVMLDSPYNYIMEADYILEESESILEADKDLYKYACSEVPEEDTPNIDYRPQLDEIITNTSYIKNIDDRDKKLDEDLNTLNTNISSILDMNSTLTDFSTNYETTLDTSFSKYSNIFGFGGYGSAPAPISFNMFGRDYVVFDISTIGEGNITLIRNTFLLFAYLFGFILVFRGQ